MPELTTETRHQSGGLPVALVKLNLDALTVADAVADVTATAGKSVTTTLRADIKEKEEVVREISQAIRFHIESLREHCELVPESHCTATVVDVAAVAG